ncbi:hypothetical protein EW026_g8397 [Hermanssonia centrifuga]|uniref:Uncharacterized protein n=1 Tax=Hermanssonia centrifuga TaxID=98765 RepID=A0A4S4K4A8_9APHY|nr:hypothetical protein EW026_g8397 [Hermanssonia centrifuga]
MLLDEVVAQDATPVPTDSEAIALKLFADSDRLKSRSDKAVKDFDDAMQLLNKLYKEGGEISYKNAVEKTAMQIAFNAFYPECQG